MLTRPKCSAERVHTLSIHSLMNNNELNCRSCVHWAQPQGMNREPLSPFRKDEFRMNVAARLCERQLLAEQSYRYVQARTTDPKVFPLWTTSAATAIAKVCQLNVQVRFDLLAVCISTLSIECPKVRVCLNVWPGRTSTCSITRMHGCSYFMLECRQRLAAHTTIQHRTTCQSKKVCRA
jgi:hypothetical protein